MCLQIYIVNVQYQVLINKVINNIMIKIINSKNIRQIMLDKNIKSVYIAEKIGMSRQGWANALARNSITEKKFTLLAIALEVNENEISGILNAEQNASVVHDNYKVKFENCLETLKLAQELIKQLKINQLYRENEIAALKDISKKERDVAPK